MEQHTGRGAKTGCAPIRWTERERRLVAQKIRELQASDPALANRASNSTACIHRAMKYVLPADRWRTFSSGQQAEWIPSYITTLEREEKANGKPPVDTSRAEAKLLQIESNRPAKNSPPQKATDTKTAEAPATEPFSAKPSLDAFSINDLIEELAGRIAAVVVPIVVRQVASQLRSALPELDLAVKGGAVVATHETRPKHMRVVIVGLMEQQRQRLADEFGQQLDLITFADDGMAPHRLEEAAKHADGIFLMRKFISHKHSGTLKRFHPTIVDGGVSTLRPLLHQFVSNAA